LQTKEHYKRCLRMGRFNISATFLIMVTFNNLFLVANSAVNFVRRRSE